jgi:hypothetical protein
MGNFRVAGELMQVVDTVRLARNSHIARPDSIALHVWAEKSADSNSVAPVESPR